MFALGSSLSRFTALVGEASALFAAGKPLGGYLVFGQKAGCGLWHSGSWMAPYLCVHGASVQLRGFRSPQSGLSGRKKEERRPQGPRYGMETEKYWRRSNSRYTSRPSKERKERPPRDPGVNVWRVSVLKKSRECFWTESKDSALCKGTMGARSVLSCRSCVKCKCSRLSSRKALGLGDKIPIILVHIFFLKRDWQTYLAFAFYL